MTEAPDRAPPLLALTAGAGPALVLLHGFGVTPPSYERTIGLLARDHQVIAPWWARVAPTWGYQACVEAVVATIEAHRLEQAALVGHSFGGAVALGVAVGRPDLAAKLVLVDALGLAAGPGELVKLGARAGHIRRYVSPPLLRGLTDHARRPRDLAALAMWGWRCDLSGAASVVRQQRTPTTVAWAEDDTLLPLWVGERLASALDARLVVARRRNPDERIEHDWPYRRPRLFAHTVSSILAE